MESLQQLREMLKQEFYVRNLYDMAQLCRSLALDTSHPALFLMLDFMFGDIARHWADRPLTVEEASSFEARLRQPLEELLDATEAGSSGEHLLQLLNELASAYLVSPPKF